MICMMVLWRGVFAEGFCLRVAKVVGVLNAEWCTTYHIIQRKPGE
jgi:hypothetical protein